MKNLNKDSVFFCVCILLFSVSSFRAEAVKASVRYTGIQETDAGFMQAILVSSINYETQDSYTYHGSCNSVNSCYWSIGFVHPLGIKDPYNDPYSYAEARKLVFDKGVTGSRISIKDIVIAMNKNISGNVAKLGRSDYKSFWNKLCIGIFITPSPDASKSMGVLLDPSLYSCSDGSGGGGLEPPPRPPSEEVTCNTLPTIEIDHGKLNASSLFLDTKEEKVLVSCSGQATVSFQLTPERLDLGGGITSKLYIDGNAGKATVGINKQRWVTFRSEISIPQKVSSGVYANTAVLLMTVQ